jgi:3-oxoadipate enol-lactonase
MTAPAADQPATPLGDGGGDDAVLFARQLGAGRPLVLLHGLLVSGEMFTPMAERLAARHRLVIPDLRGHGRSAGLLGPYPVERLAADVTRLLDRLGVARADVVGYSQGGAVAQQLARTDPQRVRRLVLACTFACNLLSARERVDALLSPWLLRAIGPGRMAGLIARAGGGPRLTREQTATLRRLLAANDRRTAVRAYRAMLAFDSRAWLGEVTAPALVVCGSADTGVPKSHAEMLARGIPNAELRTIQGAGHFMAWTHTEQFADVVEGWLARSRVGPEISD